MTPASRRAAQRRVLKLRVDYKQAALSNYKLRRRFAWTARWRKELSAAIQRTETDLLLLRRELRMFDVETLQMGLDLTGL